MALGNPTVDYFSLDVEGAEFAVLRTIPWEKVDIKVWSIEVNPVLMTQSAKQLLIKFLKTKKYSLVHEIEQDLIFMKIE